MDFQLSEISPVVRQLFPTPAAHKAGLSTPHSIYLHNMRYYTKPNYTIFNIPHIEKKIGRPLAFKASRMTGYRCSGILPSVLQLSYFK
jgi:hypothetical protein